MKIKNYIKKIKRLFNDKDAIDYAIDALKNSKVAPRCFAKLDASMTDTTNYERHILHTRESEIAAALYLIYQYCKNEHINIYMHHDFYKMYQECTNKD